MTAPVFKIADDGKSVIMSTDDAEYELYHDDYNGFSVAVLKATVPVNNDDKPFTEFLFEAVLEDKLVILTESEVYT
jgi:hypothetical protein